MGFCDFFILQIFSSFFADVLRIFCGFFCRFVFGFFPWPFSLQIFCGSIFFFPLLLQNRSLFVPSFKCQVVIAFALAWRVAFCAMALDVRACLHENPTACKLQCWLTWWPGYREECRLCENFEALLPRM